MFFPERIKSIKPNDRVLEIGPGGCPHPRSDVFLEKKFKDEKEAEGQRGYAVPLRTDKEIVYYDGGKFPFEDKEFDYVICSHVLEHVEDIECFLSELMRVGKKGYLEFPTIYYDYIYNFPQHKTFVFIKNGVIYWMLKEDSGLNRFKVINKLFYDSLKKKYTDIVDDLKPYFFQGFEWHDCLRSKKTSKLEDLCYSVFDLPYKNNNKEKSAKQNLKKLFRSLPTVVGAYKFLKKFHDFKNDFNRFRKIAEGRTPRFSLSWKDRYPCFNDKTSSTNFDRHYVYHLAWAARVLAQTGPQVHIDISSSIYFSTLVSAFINVKFFDYRPAQLNLTNLTSEKADLLTLPFENNSILSLSCMHVVEHIGLGRYGDSLDPDGDLKAIAELKRLLAPGGSLLFVVPIGKPKIMFNAHRIYSYDQIVSYFKELELKEFALIPDKPEDGGLIVNASKQMADSQTYGCGCFWFRRRV